MAFNVPYSQHHGQKRISTSPRSSRSSEEPGSGNPPGPTCRSEPMLHVAQKANDISEKSRPITPASSILAEVDGCNYSRFSTFDPVRLECLRRGVLFEDVNFPAADESLYYSRQPPFRFEWKRPGEIAGYQRLKAEFFSDGATKFEVQQGRLGDCWVLAAIAFLTSPDHRELFRRVIPADQGFHEGSYAGIFRFNFWHFGKWVEVIVDDQLPCYKGELIFINSKHPNEFWAALFEKAYAKLYGSYEALKEASIGDAMIDFTGGLTESYYLRGPKANVPRTIVNILFKALDRQSLIGCGIDPVDSRDVLETKLPSGLMAGHAYSVTDLREILLMSDIGQVPITLVRVRNPWGTKVEWNGSWGDRSEEWNSIPDYERERMGLIFRDSGEFWMDFHDFLNHFDSLDICSLTPDSPVDMPRKWYTAEYHGRWIEGFSAGGRVSLAETHWTNPQYRVSLSDTDEDDDNVCSFLIQLMQKDKRKLKHKGPKLVYIGFLVYKFNKAYPLPLKEDFFDHNDFVASCDLFINSRQIIKRISLPPGDYIVVPCTYEQNERADFYLRFFLENNATVEVVDEDSDHVDIPLPSSPVDAEKEDNFKRFFYTVAGDDMEMNAYQLQTAVNDALRKDTLHRKISVDACKTFISLLDVDGSGRLGFTEFLYLWNMLRSWKKLFYQFDTDRTGTLSSYELRKVLAAAGFKINNSTIRTIIFQFSNEKHQVDLDNFLICLAKLTKLFNVYKDYRQNGHALFTLNQWLEQSLLA